MRVTEIYASLQGESTLTGRPCVLVRFTGCSLRCRYCDTGYAFHGGEEMTVEEEAGRVREFGIPLILLTGGEPLEQTELPCLIDILLDEDYELMVETGGAVPVDDIDKRVIKVLDVKCPGSGHSEDMVWENLDRLDGKDEVKFVILDRADYDWARRVVADRLSARDGAILFSPVHGKLDPQELAGWILEDRLPVRLQLQLHKLLWPGAKRGV